MVGAPLGISGAWVVLTATLLAGSLLAMVAGLAYLGVGWRLSRRDLQGDHAMAWRFFILWWVAVGLETFVSGLLSILAGLGWIGYVEYAAGIHLNIVFLALAPGSLLAYFLYLITARRWSVLVGAVVSVAYFLLLNHILVALDPGGVGVASWRAFLTFEHVIPPVYGQAARVIGLGLPFVMALVYLLLGFRLGDTTQRYRTVLVAAGIILWVANQYVSFAIRTLPDWWTVPNRLLGLAAAFLVLAAYLPPHWLKTSLGIRSISDEGAAPEEPGGARA